MAKDSIMQTLFKFIHAADIHLDSALYGLERYEGAPVDDIRSAARRAFNNLIELAITEEVAFVLLAGDLYDGDWKDYNTGLFFVECMNRLAIAEIKVFIVAGNHDAASQITKHLKLPANVTMFSTKKPEKVHIEPLNVTIYGQGFATRAVTEDISQAYPQADPHSFNIGLLHTCLDGKPGHEPYAPCSIDGLKSKAYQYWALGHIHKREVVSKEPWIVFPGNIQGRHIRETGAKGCTLVTVDNQEVTQVEHHSLDVMRWYRYELDISDKENPDDIYTMVEELFQSSIESAQGRPIALRLILTGSCAAHSQLNREYEHWLQEFRALANSLGSSTLGSGTPDNNSAIWLEKLSIKTTQPASAEEILARQDALGGLLRTINNLEIAEHSLSEQKSEDLLNELAPLRKKLPPEMLTGEEPYDPLQSALLNDSLEEIKELLVNRLLRSDQDN